MPKNRGVHKLSGKSRNYMPAHIICLDTEAWIGDKAIQSPSGERHCFRLGHAVYMNFRRTKAGRSWRTEELAFTSTATLYDWIDMVLENVPEKETLWIVGHNLAYDFALMGFHNYLSRKGQVVLFVPNQPFLFYVQGEGCRIKCISTTNWYRGSLEQIAPLFGSFKLKTFDINTINDIPDEEVAAYCRQDTLAVVEIMKGHIKFLLDNDLGPFEATIAGQAYTAFRHRFKPDSLHVHHYQDLLNFEMASYRGGRTEAFYIGKCPEDIYVLDVNSMYPYVMWNRPYPLRPITKVPLEYASKKMLKTHYFIAECRLQVKEPFLGVKRLVTDPDGTSQMGLIFPTGNIRAILTKPEYQYIANNPAAGRVLSIERVALYEQGPVFSDYVDFFYTMKRGSEKGSIYYTMSKLFLNSLYGKLAQRQYPLPEPPKEGVDPPMLFVFDELRKEGINITTLPGEDLNGRRVKYTRLGEQIIKTYQDHTEDDLMSPNSIPSISSAVTGYARMHLWNIIMTAGRENVYYCDTDSVFTNGTGRDRLKASGMLHPTDLGALDISGPHEVTIFGLKDYIKDDTEYIKGVPKRATRLEDGEYTYERFETGLMYYNKAVSAGVPVRTVFKKLRRKYLKGIVDPDGSVRPLHITDFAVRGRTREIYQRGYGPTP